MLMADLKYHTLSRLLFHKLKTNPTRVQQEEGLLVLFSLFGGFKKKAFHSLTHWITHSLSYEFLRYLNTTRMPLSTKTFKIV